MKFTKEQIADYVLGWLGADKDTHTLMEVSAAIHNASVCVGDHSDGIEWYVKRQEYYKTQKTD